jgi:hypothetical protein
MSGLEPFLCYRKAPSSWSGLFLFGFFIQSRCPAFFCRFSVFASMLLFGGANRTQKKTISAQARERALALRLRMPGLAYMAFRGTITCRSRTFVRGVLEKTAWKDSTASQRRSEITKSSSAVLGVAAHFRVPTLVRGSCRIYIATGKNVSSGTSGRCCEGARSPMGAGR